MTKEIVYTHSVRLVSVSSCADVGEGEAHPAYAQRLQTLAELTMELGDGARAFRLATEALERTEEILGPDHPAMASRRVCLARVLVSLGDLTHVDELLDRAETDVNSRGERDPLWPRLLATRAAARTTGNKLDEAVPLLERALAASTRVFGEAHVESVRLLNQLAEVFMGRKEFAAAQTLLERGLALNRSARVERLDDGDSLDG